MIAAFETVNKIKVPDTIAQRREADVVSCYTETSYAKELLNLEANLGLNDMFYDNWNWQSKNPQRFHWFR